MEPADSPATILLVAFPRHGRRSGDDPAPSTSEKTRLCARAMDARPIKSVCGDRDGGCADDGKSRQQDESGQQRAGHGSQGIEPVKEGNVLPRLPGMLRSELRQYGQGPPHQRGGDDHRDHGEHDAEKRQVQGVFFRHPGQGNVKIRIKFRQEKKENGEDGDPDLEDAVQPQRSSECVDTFPDEMASQRKARHEHGENRRYREMGTAEDELQGAYPYHLVGQRCGARQEEQQVQERDHGLRASAVIP